MQIRLWRISAVVLAWPAIVAISVGTSAAQTVPKAEDRPNVVLIMTDNHGAWTLGCYGNSEIRTPHIDQLAADGTLFENAFACNPVCSPTRASVLTGLIPSQHGVHCFLRAGRLQTGPEARCTLDQFTSLPEVLHRAGYRCGLVGKWHLGGNLAPQEDLTDYWITMPHGGTSTFYDAQVIENGQIRTEPEYLTDFWTRHAVQFIEQQAEADDGKPFFLFLSYNGPYSLGRLLLHEGKNRHAEFYRDQPLMSFPREATHPWQLHNRDYHNNPVSIQRVATEVSGVDDGVGTVMQSLQQHGMDDNTIVIFLADQGWAGGHGGFFGMGDHTRPVTARDEMMKIPMIWRHPGRIQAGHRSEQLVANYDVMPALLTHLGLQDRAPVAPVSPGTAFSAALAGSADSNAHDAVFYEFEALRCIRTKTHKLVWRHPNGPHEFYDLQQDPTEFNNLFGQSQQRNVLSQLKSDMDAFFQTYASPQYDLWNGGGSQTVIYDGIDEETAQVEHVEPPAPPDSFQPHEFTLPEGFTAQLAAAPPLVTHPTMGCFDDQGRLYMCNNAGLNLSAQELESSLPNAINQLTDTDGDGIFDRSTVFADRMTFPMGGTFYRGSLYVASPPSIWKLTDTDDDGVADQREILVDKFGYTGNAASIHGCFLGPDGRLYWCDGYHGHEFHDREGNVTSKREGSYLFSCRPDGSDVQLFCGGGMDNPVEVDLTDEGDVIGTVNILYTRPRIDCLVHWQYGGAYPHRERVLEELKITGDLLGPIHRFGHVAVSGSLRYRSGVLDHRWQDNHFVTHFNQGRVVRVELQRKGSTYAAVERQFLACSNRDFHPTDIIEDPDGSLLVVDTGGWFYRGCPTSQRARPDVLGGIYRIRRDGMTTLPDPSGRRIDWAAQDASSLIRYLNDTRHAVREAAVDECARRGAAMIDRLATSVRTGDVRVRRNAVWALTRLSPASVLTEQQREDSLKAIRMGLSDDLPSIRQAACHSAAVLRDAAALSQLIDLLQDSSAAVRRQAAVALGRIGNAAAVEPLLNGLQAPAVDQEERHARVFAVIEINAPDAVRRILQQTQHAAVRSAAAVALMEMNTAGSIDAAIFVDGLADPVSPTGLQFRRALQRLRGDQAEEKRNAATQAAGDQLNRWLNAADVTPFVGGIQIILSELGHEPLVGDIVTKFLNRDDCPAATRTVLTDRIAASSSLASQDSVARFILQQLAAEHPDQLRVAVAMAAACTQRNSLLKAALEKTAADRSLSSFVRVQASQALAANPRQLTSPSFDLLLELIGSGGSENAIRAAQVMGASVVTSEQLNQLTPQLASVGPQSLRELLPLYQRTLSATDAAALLSALENSRSLNALSSVEVSEVVKRFPEELHDRANRLLDQQKAAEQLKLRRLDLLIGKLNEGDAERGRQLFFSEKSKCSTCHQVGDRGKRVGPDLTTIGSNRSRTDLVESIVFPSNTIVRQYEPWTVLTTDGRTMSGLMIRETSSEVTLQQQTGELITLSRSEIDELVPSTVSLMPNGFDQQLNDQQIVDLVAWLSGLRTHMSPGASGEE
ncbi:MAG: sulfatase-like hydrolase/transferase [Planctomycetaceae bacterium]|nr:sulfatase-like hydrolase/transferase [Planctomycetaceae bacterium]